jgi:hypothetical protein
MKRIAQFFLVLALMTATLAAAPKKGGSLSSAKDAGDGFYCYSDPGQIFDCGTLSECGCNAACEYECGGECDGFNCN